MTKSELRQELRRRLGDIPPAHRHERSVAACERLCAQVEYRDAQVIMIYLSTATEVDTSQLALRAWEDGKRVLAPCVSWEQRRIMPLEISSLETGLKPGYMGIREPLAGAPFPIGEIDLVIVPGLAFDQAGNRLGRGRGFYDRFLSNEDLRAVPCGLAFEEQFVAALPADGHDVRVRMLVTDAAVRRFTLGSAGILPAKGRA